MKTFRSVFFWAHLVAGLVAGISIFIMCFTGAAIAFESDIVAWSERDVRRVTPPAPDAPRLPLDEMQKRVREANPEARPSGIVVSSDPRAAVAFTLGRDGAFYVNPYTGEVKQPASPNKVHDFLHVMEDWHRVLAMGGDNRPIGKAINGACNLAFFFLAISGMYIWIPRVWSWRSVRGISLFNGKLSGKARDFNWHNVIGIWSAPILIVLTLTAVPISYRWGSNLVYRLVGEEPPVQQGPGGAATGPAVEVPKPEPGTRPLGSDALFAAAQKQVPQWELITLRTGGGFGARGAQRGPGAQAAGTAQQNSTRPAGENRPAGEARREGGNTNTAVTEPRREGGNAAGGEARREGSRAGGEGRPAAQAVALVIKQPGSWPRTATTTLTLNPYTGEALKQENFSDLSAGRQLRTWTRFLHTGQALGFVGQLVAGLACLGGCVLCYTGFALAWRRFFGKSASTTRAAVAAKPAEVSSSSLSS